MIECSNVPINDTIMKLYVVLQNPQIVGLIPILDIISNKPNHYCHYCG